jgi:hypothetical protein
LHVVALGVFIQDLPAIVGNDPFDLIELFLLENKVEGIARRQKSET